MQPFSEPPAPSSEPAADARVAPEQPPCAPTQSLSKNAQKRLAKAAYIAEQKKERRAAEKQRKKEKKRILAEKRAAGELDEDEEARAFKKRRTGDGPRRPFRARVVVDLGFDDKMTDNEVKSLTSQLAYTYSANRKAEQPFEHLLFTSLSGRTLSRMESMSNAAYKRWVNAEFWSEGYERLWEQSEATNKEGSTSNPFLTAEGEATRTKAQDLLEESVGQQVSIENKEALATTDAADDSGQHTARLRNGKGKEKPPSSAPKESVVYLTADSQDELTELKEGETYIIGGIVDHNRYKNLCLGKAESSGMRSARLPIGTYLASLKTRKVLTVNQTFEILLKWVETRDWEQALEAVIPKRKFNAEGRRRGGKLGKEDDGGGGDGEDDEGEGSAEMPLDATETEEVVQVDEAYDGAGDGPTERTNGAP
ncbi:hypothetical protein DAEQUDRAFT_750450 [Daedalea quercina L-15889]|uniref:tRNA (guanine(9)-N1)-methyltransferase n=1 Tax=Daedalea quercina L-15889 TaxID=1314783 RepID=A0A165R5E1_9APHY|nr:hypothetical protein DAEQUDRAFT_750450 [Daedalea quercina L-15889]